MSEQLYLVQFGPHANCTFEPCTVHQSVYGYRPSLIANGLFIGLFSLAMVVHVYLGIRWKSWWFMWCMILGCTHEIAGYVARILLYENPWNFGAFITQIICITQAPVFFCAAIYVTLAQTIEYCSPSLARFSPKLLAWIFLPCDFVSLSLQGAGGGLSAASSGDDPTGVNIAMAGLVFQVVTLVIFCGLFVDYLSRYLRSARAVTQLQSGRGVLFFVFLGLAMLLTLTRCIFRAYELKDGYHGTIIRHEDLFIALEGGLITASVFCLLFGHPGFMIKDKKRQGYRDVKTSEPSPDAADEQGILLTTRDTAYGRPFKPYVPSDQSRRI